MKGYIKHGLGFKTKRKLVIFESDDWGSIRIPDAASYELLKEKGLATSDPSNADFRYQKYDSLATAKDLERLFEVLHSVKDVHGNPAKFTPVSNVANPDFKAIEASGYKKYSAVNFFDQLKEWGEHATIDLWMEGQAQGFFYPEFHGREHLNVAKWMRALQAGDERVLEGFHKGYFAVSIPGDSNGYVASYDYRDDEEIEQLKAITADGLELFEANFGRRSTYFVPPNGPYSTKLNGTLKDLGIEAIQTARLVVNEPVGKGKVKKRLRVFGSTSKEGLVYTQRNAFFEPNEQASFDWIDLCMRNLEEAFAFGKPAMVSTHRVNYSGRLSETNRDQSLAALQELLKRMIAKWPDVEFLTSAELLRIMKF